MTKKSLATDQLKNGLKLDDGSMLKLIHIDKLESDSSYQRPSSRGKIEQIARHFNPSAMREIAVGQRKGTKKFFICDGQHRVEALKFRRDRLQEKDTPEYVRCVVFLNTTLAKEAELFNLFNTAKASNGNDRFRARLAHAGNPEHTIEKILKQYGFTIEFNSGRTSRGDHMANGIRGAAQMLKAFEIYHEPNFRIAIELMDKSDWGRNYYARKGELVWALAAVSNEFNGNGKPPLAKWIKGLNSINPYELSKESEAEMSSSEGRKKWMANQIASQFNLQRPFKIGGVEPKFKKVA